MLNLLSKKDSYNLERIADALDKLSNTEIVAYQETKDSSSLHRINVSEDTLEQVAEEEASEMRDQAVGKINKLLKSNNGPFYPEDALSEEELEAMN